MYNKIDGWSTANQHTGLRLTESQQVFLFFFAFTTSFLGQVLANITMEQMEYGSYSLGERKGGVFQNENVKNEDLELHDFTANQGVTFLFPNEKNQHSLFPSSNHASKKRTFKKCSRARKNI